MTTPQTDTEIALPETAFAERVEDFLRTAVEQLHLPHRESGGVLTVELAEPDRHAFDGQSEVLLALSPPQEEGGGEADEWNRSFDWLVEKLSAGQDAPNAMPVDQPASVNDIVPGLFAAYQIEGGQAHLGGCQLIDEPFLRLSYLDAEGQSLRHVFVGSDGSPVDYETVRLLGLDQTEWCVDRRPPRLDRAVLDALLAAGKRAAQLHAAEKKPAATAAEPRLVSVLWVKRAVGHIEFTIGGSNASQPFEGWTRTLQPTPFVGPYSGLSGYHVAATDAGEIDVAEAIDTCQRSGERALISDLVECPATGERVHRRFTRRCPVSGEECVEEAFAVCPSCRQEVASPALGGDACDACLSG